MSVSWVHQAPPPGMTREQVAQIQQAAREAAQQAREQAQQAREQAQQAREQAREQAQQIREQARDNARDEIRRAMEEVQKELARQGIGRRGGEVVIGQPPMFPPGPSDVIPEGAIILGIGFFVACVITIIGLPIARAFSRRVDRRTAAIPSDSAEMRTRLERIEQAVDTIALEVERISEGQRFTSQILGELRALPAANPLENGIGAKLREREGMER